MPTLLVYADRRWRLYDEHEPLAAVEGFVSRKQRDRDPILAEQLMLNLELVGPRPLGSVAGGASWFEITTPLLPRATTVVEDYLRLRGYKHLTRADVPHRLADFFYRRYRWSDVTVQMRMELYGWGIVYRR